MMFKITNYNVIFYTVVLLSILTNECFGNVISQSPTAHQQIQSDQYSIHEKQQQQQQQHQQQQQQQQDQKLDQLAEEQDPYHLTNDFKLDHQLPYTVWNPYRQTNFATPSRPTVSPNRFLNFIGYPNPIILPLPVLIQPTANYLYPYPMIDDYEDPLSRTNSRRPSQYRNSPIYYVRVPPSPYMFIPGLGYTSQPPTFTPNFAPLSLPYNSIPTLPIQQSISPLINLPVNFLSNGKPTNIYQLDPNEQQQQYHPFGLPSPPPPPRPYRPAAYQPAFTSSDSKITHLKRPFIFNGKPEEIYFLPNNFNTMQSLHPIYQPSAIPNYQPSPITNYQPSQIPNYY